MRIKLKLFLLLYLNYMNGWTESFVLDPKTASKINEYKYFWEFSTKVKPFNQLIFCWNAFRPNFGHFSFAIQAKKANSNSWCTTHKAAEWGTDKFGNLLQQSFFTDSKETKFVHVRLELPENKFADGFRIYVKTTNPEYFQLLRKIFVTTSNFKDFKSELNENYFKNLETKILKGVPKKSQMIDHKDSNSLCSPASLAMLLGYKLKKNFNIKLMADGVFDNGLKAYGNWPFNIAHAFELSKGKYYFQLKRLTSFKELHAYLLKHCPVIVSIRGPISGSATPYANGHLLVVIGYDKNKQTVICHDPAFKDDESTLMFYDIKDFITAWERSKRLAYVPYK